jgi:hypothetical protein
MTKLRGNFEKVPCIIYALARMGERISVGPDLPAFAAMSEEIGTGLLLEAR